MTKGRKYLKLVLEKLNSGIDKMHMVIEDVQKDIVSMNDYYWENYTEMDQYGYEDFDNRRALVTQVNANEENRQKLFRMKKMVEAETTKKSGNKRNGKNDNVNASGRNRR